MELLKWWVLSIFPPSPQLLWTERRQLCCFARQSSWTWLPLEPIKCWKNGLPYSRETEGAVWDHQWHWRVAVYVCSYFKGCFWGFFYAPAAFLGICTFICIVWNANKSNDTYSDNLRPVFQRAMLNPLWSFFSEANSSGKLLNGALNRWNNKLAK